MKNLGVREWRMPCELQRRMELTLWKKSAAFAAQQKLPLALPKNAIDECVSKIKANTIDTVTILSAMVLHDEFEFGKSRIQRFVDRFNKKAECIMDDYATWEDQIQILREECGLDFKIRRNETDVKVK